MKTFRPTVEALEDRCTPAGLMPYPAAPATTYPTPPPGSQVIVFADLLDNMPLIPGQHGFVATPAEPSPLPQMVNVFAYLRNVAPAGTDATGNAYWFLPNASLPPGFVPGSTAPQHAAIGQAFAGSTNWMVGASLALGRHDAVSA